MIPQPGALAAAPGVPSESQRASPVCRTPASWDWEPGRGRPNIRLPFLEPGPGARALAALPLPPPSVFMFLPVSVRNENLLPIKESELILLCASFSLRRFRN